MNKKDYPLKQVLEIKQKRVEDAEQVVRLKQQALDLEKEKLQQVEEARNKVKQHRQDKLTQLRHELDQGTTSPKIQQMKAYLKVVDERLKIEEKKVAEQKAKVQAAAKELEAAKHQLHLKRQEVEKIQYHRKDWEKIKHKEEAIIEGREQDELGSVIHGIHRRQH